ncbi:MAG: hypothetical protein WC455_12730 [Dehalococcoidia bacterium]|jgi:hypothetical protein
MAISEANVIAAIQALTAFSVQTSAEATAVQNTSANILYSSASRTQGNFTIFLAIGQDQLAKDLLQIGKTATTAQQEKALALLCGAYQEAKDPDIFAKSVSFDGYSVSRDGQSGYMKAYGLLLDALPLAGSSSVLSASDLDCTGKVADDTNYPESWKLTGLVDEVSNPF